MNLKPSLYLLIFVFATTLAPALTGGYQRGMIVRMRMAECMSSGHSWMAALAGTPQQQAQSLELCPEYTLVTDKVVYVIVGKSSNQVVPLAESTLFYLQKSELLIRVDDARHEWHFAIREMVLRPEWERYEEQRVSRKAISRQRLDPSDMVEETQ